jgi:molybdopterin-guanine dinucleotide biosynthesis protein A
MDGTGYKHFSEGVTGTILAGGRSTRMGRNKALLPVGDRTLIEWVVGTIAPLVDPLFIITNDPASYRFLHLPTYGDVYQGCGALGGLHAALVVAPTDACLVVACDLLFLTSDFLGYLIGALHGYDVAVPVSNDGYQPLCAMYAKACIGPVERQLLRQELKVIEFYREVRVREVGPEIIDRYDPEGRLFSNINTPEDYDRAVRAFTFSTRSRP